MANNFLLLMALGAVGWFVADGSPSQRQPSSPTSRLSAVITGTSSTTAGRTTALEARRSPVPLVRKVLPPSITTTASGGVSAVSAELQQQPQPELQPEDALDRSAARAAVEADGYKRVSIQSKGSNGAWHARGYRGTTEVALTVDAMGRVSMQ